MRPYEVMIIFDVELEKDDISERVGRVTELVKSRGGTPGHLEHWGRRAFAYELNHHSEGYYVLVEMAAEPETMAEIGRSLGLDDAVLRHKVIRQPDRVAARSRSSSGTGRRSGPRGPGASPRPPAGGRPASDREAGSRRSSALPGERIAGAPSTEQIEGAERPDSGRTPSEAHQPAPS